MNVAIAVRHPEHVRFYRDAVAELRERGHGVRLLARDHASTVALLDDYGLPHTVFAGEASTPAGLVLGHLVYEARVLAYARSREVDVLTSVGGRTVSHVAPLVGARSVVFADWTPTRVDRVVAGLADAVCTPSFLAGEFGDRQVTYEGLHELAYLDPVTGSEHRFEDATTRPAAPYAVLGVRDPSTAGEWYGTVRDRLARRGRVALVSASGTDAADGTDAVDRRYAVADDEVEGLLAGATACVSELGTTATEAAVLGTPTVLVADDPPARCLYLRDEYDLVVTTSDATTDDAVASLLADTSAGDRWRRRRRRLLDDADDVTDRIVAGILGDLAPE